LPSAYLTGVGDVDDKDLEVVFSDELGLAVEALPEGVHMEDLWKII
jgi:hypothetical protein